MASFVAGDELIMVARSLVVDVDHRSLCFGTEGVVTGRIILRYGNICFPEAGWNDFVAVVLSWWVEAAIDLCGPTGKSRELRFMDGPFWVDVTRTEPSSLQFCFVHGQKRPPQVVFSAKSNAGVFWESLIATSQQLLKITESRDFYSYELSQLGRLEKELDELYKKQGS